MSHSTMATSHAQRPRTRDSFGRQRNDFCREAKRRLVPDQSGRWFWLFRNYNEVRILLRMYKDMLHVEDAAEELLTKVIAPLAAGTYSLPLVNPCYANAQKRAHLKRVRKRIGKLTGMKLLVYKVTLRLMPVGHGRPEVESLEQLAPLLEAVANRHAVGSAFRVEIARTGTGMRTNHVHGIVLVRAASEMEALRREWAATAVSHLPKHFHMAAFRSLTHAHELGGLDDRRWTERYGEESVIDAALNFFSYGGKALQGNYRPWDDDCFGHHGNDAADFSLISESQTGEHAMVQSAARVNTLTDILAFSDPEKKIRCAITTGILDGRKKLPRT